MNIFVLHSNSHNAAIYHCDKHCVKMILEICQMLYTAWHCSDSQFDWFPCIFNPFKLTHKNHPVSIWIRENKHHYLWALNLALDLCTEYTLRFHKIHKCFHHLFRLSKMGPPPPSIHQFQNINKNKIATIHCPDFCSYFYCAIPDHIFYDCAVYVGGELSARETYRNYYKTKSFDMKWYNNNSPPYWFQSLIL